jgi:hypothetical protein
MFSTTMLFIYLAIFLSLSTYNNFQEFSHYYIYYWLLTLSVAAIILFTRKNINKIIHLLTLIIFVFLFITSIIVTIGVVKEAKISTNQNQGIDTTTGLPYFGGCGDSTFF